MSGFTGTTSLTWVALRRDRWLASVWVSFLGVVVYASAAATTALFPSRADRISTAEAINGNRAVVGLYGPILDPPSEGELAMSKLTVLYAVLVALLFVVLVRRHTRVEEESGRAELLGGTVVGRHALLAAAALEAGLVALVLGVLAAVADVAGGLPFRGSVGFAASWTGVGVVAVGLTALACQLSSSARTCAAVALSAIGALFVVRVVGDTGPGWLSWLSPFGWSTRLRAWGEPRWWLLGLYAGLGAVLLGCAFAVQDRRDLGAGVLPARAGPRYGSPQLDDALLLTWRLNQTAFWSWTAGTTVVGLVMGAIAPTVGDLLDTEAGRRVLESLGGVGALQDALVGSVLSIASVVITCFAISVVTRGAVDEHDGRTEQVLATPVSRSRAFAATALVASGGATLLLALTGAATAVGLGVQAGGGGGALGRFLGAALAQVPAVLVVGGLVLVLYGIDSRLAVAGWGLLALFSALGLAGDLLHLPPVVTGLSPFSHVPAMPVEGFAPLPEVALMALAAALVLVAWWRFRERDIG